MANNKPVWKKSAGAISVALWRNESVVNGKTVERFNATVERRYRQGEEWRSTGSFGINDVPRLIWGLTQAYGKMLEKPHSAEGDGGDDPVM